MSPDTPFDAAASTVLASPVEAVAAVWSPLSDTGPARAYLAEVGLDDPALLRALAIGDPVVRGHRRATGAVWATRDPRQPDQVIGAVRLARAQHKHQAITDPVGLGCHPDLAASDRVLLCSSPLSVLRLQQAGHRDVALIEDPAALVPLADWLRERRVLVLAQKRAQAVALRAVLGSQGVASEAVQVSTDPAKLQAGVRAALDLPPVSPARPMPTPQLLQAIAEYARRQVLAGQGVAQMRDRGVAHPDLLGIYHAGYLPPGWRQALPAVDTAGVTGLCGHALCLPATDDQDRVVDLALYRLCDSGGLIGAQDPPRGLLGRRVVRSCRRIMVVDRLADLGRLVAAGHLNVWLVRGLADLRANLPAVIRAGVEAITVCCWYDRPAVLEVCRHAGLQVTDGPRFNALEHAAEAVGGAEAVTDADSDTHSDAEAEEPQADVEVDAEAEADAEADAEAEADVIPLVIAVEDQPEALAVADDDADPTPLTVIERLPEQGLTMIEATDPPVVYRVEVPWHETTTWSVLVRHTGRTIEQTLDLAVPTQVERFARQVGRTFDLDQAVITEHLDQLPGLVAGAHDQPDRTPTDLRAVVALRQPTLLADLLQALEDAGWVGDHQAKVLGLLTLVSRRMDDPLWVLLQGPTAITAQPLQVLADCLPATARLHCSRLTGASLYHLERDALQHRLLVVDDADTLRSEAAMTLRVLQARGGLSIQQAERDSATGRLRTRAHQAEGPVALLATATGRTAITDQVVTITLDTSPEQTARVLARQSRSRQRPATDGQGPATADDPLARLRSCLSALEALPVEIPFAERIDFPATRIEHRRDHQRFLTLIEASARLHQFQRPVVAGVIQATEADFQIARQAATGVLGTDEAEYSDRAAAVLRVLTGDPQRAWTLADLQAAMPGTSRTTIHRALQELQRIDLVAGSGSQRGRQARTYWMVEDVAVDQASASVSAIRLLPVTQAVAVGAGLRPPTSDTIQPSKLSTRMDGSWTVQPMTGA